MMRVGNLSVCTTSQAPTTQAALLDADALCEPFLLMTVQDLGGLQDHHAEKDVQESQRANGQDASASHCPLASEQELLARRPQCYRKRKAPLRFEATHRDDRADSAASPQSNCAAE